jgi:hypothetical protein
VHCTEERAREIKMTRKARNLSRRRGFSFGICNCFQMNHVKQIDYELKPSDISIHFPFVANSALVLQTDQSIEYFLLFSS